MPTLSWKVKSRQLKDSLKTDWRAAYSNQPLRGGVLEPTKIQNDKHPKASSVNWSGVLRGPLAKVHDLIFGSISSEDVRTSAQLRHCGAGPSGLDALGMRRILCSKEVRPASNDLCSALALISRKLCKTHTDPSSVEALLASRLLALDKFPGVHPIGIGEAMRRIIGKTFCRKLKTVMEMSSGHLQLAAGHVSGIDATIRSMRNFFNDCDSDGVLLVDAANAFNLLNRRVALHNVQYSCPCVNNCPQFLPRCEQAFHLW